ncbi:MAG: YdeI/OmpD-associated family protein [Bdellovibrionales bacterium]|nr:YdeI/OmpD-associated family protein [Bdellovibrionales bacterium]
MTEKNKKDVKVIGPVHKLPSDFKATLHSQASIVEVWKSLTPLARNEWICWVISAKKEETRIKRIHRAIEDLGKGKKRPCCWPGCPHRRPSAAKWFQNKSKK